MIPYSYNGHVINDDDYFSQFQDQHRLFPVSPPAMVQRAGAWPLLTSINRPGRTLELRIAIQDESNLETLRGQISRWFDPEDETPKALLASRTGSAPYRYVMAVCTDLREMAGAKGAVLLARFTVDGDVRWRAVEASADTWSIGGSPVARALTNNGEDDAYPKFTFTPTNPKSGSNIYRHWIAIVWRATAGAARYPVDIVDNALDTAALVTAGELQADADDIRVIVDGQEVEYWLDDINTVDTSIWANLDFEPAPPTTALLEAAIANVDTVTSIDSSTDISGYPSSGILLINSEAFVYTGKSDSLRRFTGVSRAAKGTTAASHSAGDSILWVQHDIYITYGNATASAYPVDNNNKPAFNLANSSNTSWDYDDFGEDDGLRTGAWGFSALQNIEKYTGSQTASADPWAELGQKTLSPGPYSGRWTLVNPCGITNANFANGEKWSSNLGQWAANVISQSSGGLGWSAGAAISAPSAASTWESWSSNAALATGSVGVGLQLANTNNYLSGEQRIEVADVTLTLNSASTPAITVGAQQGNYALDAVIRNITTGDEIRVTMTMDEDVSLEVDTDEKTVTYSLDGSNQFGAVEVVGDARVAWLKLVPGTNNIRFEDTGTTGITIETEWEERFYG